MRGRFIVMRRLKWWKRVLFLVWPPARRAWHRELHSTIEWLMAHPEVPVLFPED